MGIPYRKTGRPLRRKDMVLGGTLLGLTSCCSGFFIAHRQLSYLTHEPQMCKSPINFLFTGGLAIYIYSTKLSCPTILRSNDRFYIILS